MEYMKVHQNVPASFSVYIVHVRWSISHRGTYITPWSQPVAHLSASGLVGRREVHIFFRHAGARWPYSCYSHVETQESQELAAARRRLQDTHLQKHARPVVTMASVITTFKKSLFLLLQFCSKCHQSVSLIFCFPRLTNSSKRSRNKRLLLVASLHYLLV